MFFVAGLSLMLAGAGAGIADAATDVWWLHWVTLHLVFLGGISQLVLGAGQFFVCAFLATDPPSRRMIGTQVAVWNAGVVLVAVSVPTATPVLAEAGGGLIGAGLALFAVALVGMERRSLQQARWAVRWYEAAAACLGLGALIGVLMARGTLWTHGSLLGAHLALNLGGWFGTAIVGTLHTFFPSLTQTLLRHPRLQGPTFVLWLTGVAELAAGATFDSRAVIAFGWLSVLLAAVLLSVNLMGSLRTSPTSLSLSLPARLVALAQAFLPAGLVLALVTTLADGTMAPFAGAPRAALATLLVAGWIGLTVAGALMHLLAVLARVRNFRRSLPAPRPARDRALTAAAGISVVTLALSHIPSLDALATPATLGLLAVGVLLAGRVATLALGALAPARS